MFDRWDYFRNFDISTVQLFLKQTIHFQRSFLCKIIRNFCIDVNLLQNDQRLSAEGKITPNIVRQDSFKIDFKKKKLARSY